MRRCEVDDGDAGDVGDVAAVTAIHGPIGNLSIRNVSEASTIFVPRTVLEALDDEGDVASGTFEQAWERYDAAMQAAKESDDDDDEDDDAKLASPPSKKVKPSKSKLEEFLSRVVSQKGRDEIKKLFTDVPIFGRVRPLAPTTTTAAAATAAPAARATLI